MSGLRLIALTEAAKGLIVLLAGLGVLEYLHRHIQHFGNMFSAHAGLNPHHHYPKALLQFLSGVTDQKIMWLALGIVAYSSLRLIEAYGLWNARAWARWLGIASGGFYLPYEFYELLERFSWVKLGITFVNILVVIYLINSQRSSAKRM